MKAPSTMTANVRPATTRPSLGRVGQVSLVAAVIASIDNVALGLVLRSGLAIDPAFPPLTPAAIVVFTMTFTLAGGAVFAVMVRRRPADAVHRFTILAVVVLILSLAAPLSLLGATEAQWPGVSTTAAFALVPLHLVAATVLVAAIRRSFPVGRGGEKIDRGPTVRAPGP